MTTTSARFRVPFIAAGLLAAAVFLVGVQAVAVHTLPLLSPSVVATVDLERTFNGLEEWSKAQASEGTLSERIQEDLDTRQGEIEMLEADLEDYPEGSSKYDDAMKKLRMAALEYQGYIQFQKLKQERRNQDTIFDLYEKIKASAASLADEQGYDIILVNDSVVEIPEQTENVIQEISSRRVLFARVQMDITDQLIEAMNAEHQATTASK